jgi:hypothetical protein
MQIYNIQAPYSDLTEKSKKSVLLYAVIVGWIELAEDVVQW